MNRIIVRVAFFLLIFSGSLCSQNFLDQIGLMSIEDVSTLVLPQLDNDELNRRHNKDVGNKPFRFAEARDVHVDFNKDGSWEILKSGDMVWRQKIRSTGAYSINLAFTEFQLAGDAELYIYNSEKTEIYGPFTEEDNADHNQLWTPMVGGDEIIVDLRVSPLHMPKCRLVLSRVNHDFADVRKSVLSGACNLDVACGEEDGFPIVENYRDIISSVGAYTLNGIDQCSGVLINNTAQDFTPYFLTADHCDITNGNAASVVVFWNYENSTCRPPGSVQSGRPGDGPRNDFNSGAILRASLFNSDFALIELDDPINPELNLFFAGWDLSSELPDTSVCIHHPNVEEKRISFEFNPLVYDLSGQDSTNIRVLDWDIGTTEPGSSGSPLFNAEGLVIGQLEGGLAACGNNEYDTYGWIRYSWDANPDPNSSLKTWLDPLNLGPESLDGRSLGFSLDISQNYIEHCAEESDLVVVELMASAFFDETVNYSITSQSPELQVELLFDSGSKSEVNMLTVSGLSGLSEDRYTVELRVDDGNKSADALLDIELFESTPEQPSLDLPEDEALNIPTNTVLEIRRSGKVVNEFELAIDPDFNEVIDNRLTDARKIDITGLANDTRYYWRVKSTNACGSSDWSETFSFTTVSTFCTNLYSSDGPITIEASSANTINSIITVPYPVIGQDINVLNVRGTHEYVGDLQMRLEFNNRSSILMSELCDDDQDFNLGFDDQSEDVHIPCPPTDGNIYRPLNALSQFGNMLAGGDWGLQIDDLVSFDGGEFEEWSFQVCFSEAVDAAVVPESHRINYCKGEKVNFNVFYDLGSFGSDFELRAYDRNNTALDIESSPQLTSLSTLNASLATSTLDQESNVRIELISLPSEAIVAMAVVELIDNGTGASAQVNNLQDGDVLKPNDFELISWSDVGALSYDLLIAKDPDFTDIVLDIDLTDEETSYNPSDLELEEGEYYIRIISYHDCASVYSETVRIVLDSTSSATDIASDLIKVLPNPSTGLFVINLPVEDVSQVKIGIYDAAGRQLDAGIDKLSAQSYFLDMSTFSNGIYMMRIQYGNSIVFKQLVKI